jgi:hypothetical protein
MNTVTAGEVDIHVRDRASMDALIDDAVQGLVALARDAGSPHGILLQRLNHTHFRLALSPSVPFGYTRESDNR